MRVLKESEDLRARYGNFPEILGMFCLVPILPFKNPTALSLS